MTKEKKAQLLKSVIETTKLFRRRRPIIVIALEYVVPVIVTVAVIAGLTTWIFYPAWLAAIANGLEWEESELSNPNTSRPTQPVQPSILLCLV
jgi:hypothetical protein